MGRRHDGSSTRLPVAASREPETVEGGARNESGALGQMDRRGSFEGARAHAAQPTATERTLPVAGRAAWRCGGPESDSGGPGVAAGRDADRGLGGARAGTGADRDGYAPASTGARAGEERS